MRAFSALVTLSLLLGKPLAGQDSALAPRPLQPDAGSRHAFTGREDSTLLAAGFIRPIALAEQQSEGLFGPTVLCLALGDFREHSDPPASVFRLVGSGAPVVAQEGSRCTVERTGRRDAVRDVRTGNRGWFLWIHSLDLRSPAHAVLDLGFYVGPLHAADWVCEARRSAGGWEVGACRMTRVS